MTTMPVTTGVFVVDIPEAGLNVLCGSPPDVVKHLMKRGFIVERRVGDTVFESGPNAILLSDVPVQGGVFANMIEFPILQMFYRQGMIIPGHPGNTGRKPLVIGLSSQLSAMSEYLFRGTYGLANEKEIAETGVPKSLAKEILRYKMLFAYNKMRKTEEIVDLISVDTGSIKLPGGVEVKRLGLNRYAFLCEGKQAEVNLNLKEGNGYEASVHTDFHRVKRDYFSVIHVGEGDGWDYNRPCMASIVCFQGKFYLIDTGPNILESLTALGISVNEIEGIFHTHAHDDHFAGLTSLVRSDHRIKYFATPLVRNSVRKKLSAVMSVPESRFMRSFEVHDLKLNDWNDVDGMEVMPVIALHPVETTNLFFRAMSEGGYKVYAHFADIASFSMMDQMLLKDPGHTEVSEKLHTFMSKQLTRTVNLKKIDIGGGMIHGNAADFSGDLSHRVVLAHIARDLTIQEKETGSSASFGMEDTLIPSNEDYTCHQAARYLHSYFPDAKEHDLDMLMNCPIIPMNMGSIIQKKGSMARYVYLVVNGVAELIVPDTGSAIMLSAGTIIGETNVLSNEPFKVTYRTKSHVNVLVMPAELYVEFISRTYEIDEIRRIRDITLFLQTTWLFGEAVSSPVHDKIAKNMDLRTVAAGTAIGPGASNGLHILQSGRLKLMIEDTSLEEIGVRDFFGEDALFLDGEGHVHAEAVEDSSYFFIPAADFPAIPIVEWKMLETWERRLMLYGKSIGQKS